MREFLRKTADFLAPLIDIIFSVPTLLSCYWMKLIRKIGVSRLPFIRRIFRTVGIYPIRDHYYEPLFNSMKLKDPLDRDRELPGIDWNLDGQIEFLKNFSFQKELLEIQKADSKETYSFKNDTYRAGDSEVLYSMIRYLKPRRMIEIGSGNSTLMAIEALRKNRAEDLSYSCEHICVEPFERPWLEKLEIKLIRQLVENINTNIFESLERNDILFIDSSHIIRPQGDVLFEYLRILPILRSGVYVHVHDIFSPKDYLKSWIEQEMKLWNEQDLLEAFLSNNSSFKIISALNFLKHKAPYELSAACPVFGQSPNKYEPGSFWIYRA